eukprot:5567852-Ditylum_brightwellii.AAC.1
MAVHNNACKGWIQCPTVEKMWSIFCEHFTNAHRYLHELQANATKSDFTTHSMYDNTASQMAEAIAQLAAAAEEDCLTLSNLSESNAQLVDQVANMTRQMTQKNEEIVELRRSIQQLTTTIQALITNDNTNTPHQNNQTNSGGNGGRG